MSIPVVDILMYHSISDGSGPTCISPAIFAQQMQVIAESGVEVIDLDDLVAATAGTRKLAEKNIIITFDDGFVDFAESAWPILKKYGFKSIVYLPTGHIGGSENWVGAPKPGRPIMNWDQIKGLSAQGVMFGSHAITHRDLNGLDADELIVELSQSDNMIEDVLKKPVFHFAPPYGLANDRVRDLIAQEYHTSVGTRLGRATETSVLNDLPRLEMYYFKDIARWQRHLAGLGRTYLWTRIFLRGLGNLVQKPWQ